MKHYLRILAFNLFVLVLIESGIRALFFFPSNRSLVRDIKSRLLTRLFYGDEYWRAFFYVFPEYRPHPRMLHAKLGWSKTFVAPENPFGLNSSALRNLKSPKTHVHFYGSSFVEGRAGEDGTLPELANRCLTNAAFIDMGVGGYGLDQSLLFFRETRHVSNRPKIIFGLTLTDLPHAGLTFRIHHKPYFTFEHDQLKLHGSQAHTDWKYYVSHATPEIGSYFFKIFQTALYHQMSERADNQQTDKLNRAIIHAMTREVREISDSPLFIILYNREALFKATEEERFLIQTLNDLGSTYLDTKPLLLQAAQTKSHSPLLFYDSSDGHHNRDGNELISKAICRKLEQEGFK